MALFALTTLYAVLLVAGWLAARKIRGGGAADLLVAGRAMPVWLATLTMTATWVDGGYLLGTAEGAYATGLASGLQGGLCFGLSLVLAGLFFAGRMRQFAFTTLIDPFEARFGRYWALVLSVPAVMAELFWSAELLVAAGSTSAVLLDVPLVTAIAVAVLAVTAFTAIGGMWSVAYTDAIQFVLVALGLACALPFVLDASGGLATAWTGYVEARGERGRLLPPLAPTGEFWTHPSIVHWWGVSTMLVFGGIPWNCYFQRVLSCQTAVRAQIHSVVSGILTMALTVPPLLFGIAAFRYEWMPPLAQHLQAHPAQAMPMLLQHATPPLVAILGLAAIVSAVTSSFSSSILSAASMASWNGVHRLLRAGLRDAVMRRLIRASIVVFAGIAAAIAFRVQSVQALWFFTSDLVFVLLFPQLLWALFDPRANRIGSMAAFAISLVLRLGGGEPLFDIPAAIPYPEIFTSNPSEWYDGGVMLFPFKVLAAGAGLVVLPVVSRLTAHWDPPRKLGSTGE